MSGLRWRAGDAGARAAVEAWWRGRPPASPGGAADVPRLRSLERLHPDDGPPLWLKRFRRRGLDRGPRAWLRGTPADREWRALWRLAERGAPVPAPRGRALGPGGEDLLVLEHRPGAPASALRGAPPRRRRAGLEALGRAVARLHRAGFVHGDLHLGNLLCGVQGAVLLDLQRARRRTGARARARDLGALDFSLAHAGFSRADRLRVRRAALGLAPGDRSQAARRALRAVGRAARRRALGYWRSRTRRAGRPGRRFAALRLGGRRGLRCREFPETAAERALDLHEATADAEAECLKSDHRSRITAVRAGGRRVVVKEVRKSGPGRRVADLLRGSPARRAWLAGHGLAARRLGAARPLAYVEWRRLGVPLRSAVILEDLRPAVSAQDADRRDFPDSGLADAFARLLRDLHARGVEHGDLQALHVYLEREGERIATRLIDLEGVRFRRRLPERARVQALAELNASLPDARLDPAARLRVFERYARALPFASGSMGPGWAARLGRALGARSPGPREARRRAGILEEVVRRSLARGHAWRGSGCELAETSGSRPAPAPQPCRTTRTHWK